jgi:hypothetical protein
MLQLAQAPAEAQVLLLCLLQRCCPLPALLGWLLQMLLLTPSLPDRQGC